MPTRVPGSAFVPYTTLFRSRGAVRIAREVHEAAVADAHAVEPGPLGLGTVLAEHADADHDEPGIEVRQPQRPAARARPHGHRSEEHTPELQSRVDGVCRRPL